MQVIATEPTDTSSGGSRGGGRGGPGTPFIFRPNRNNFCFWRPAPLLYLRVRMTAPPPPLPDTPPLSQGLDPALIRELKQRRRRRQRERQKRNRLNKQNNNFARASCFFVHFFTVTVRLRRGNAYFHVL